MESKTIAIAAVLFTTSAAVVDPLTAGSRDASEKEEVSAGETQLAVFPGDGCGKRRGPRVVINLPNATQGPFWPPSAVVNGDGDFILVGQVLTEVQPGLALPVPNQAVIVSKDTVPPLDETGTEDPDNWFAAPYAVLRPLNLRPGSHDLETVLYANSFGPSTGDFGGAPRIPRLGDSAYNLNGNLDVCPEVFPAIAQRALYTRPRVPLHAVPILGFQGDGVAYDVDTGSAFDPMTTTGPDCGLLTCPGEDRVDQRPDRPITLGDWLAARGRVSIRLVNYDGAAGGYTHAEFRFQLHNLVPKALYTVSAVRLRQVPVPGVFERRSIDPLAVPNVIVSDGRGRARATFMVENPFPNPVADTNLLRIIGLSVVYHSDYQTWGACFARLGSGVDAHAVFNTLVDGSTQLTELVTYPPSGDPEDRQCDR